MKRIAFLSLTLLLALAVEGQNLYVGTYNIRNKNSYDSLQGNVWQVRSKVICDLINFEQPDIFGTQEALIGQIRDMLPLLDGYRYIGVAREDGHLSGEHSAIFYKVDRLQLIDSGNFWLSTTPHQPSKGWDAACVRICSWGEFKELSSGRHFFFFNLHMDHVGVEARRQGAQLVVRQIDSIAHGLPAILTGDFNVDQTNEIYSIFTQQGHLTDSYEAAPLRLCENGTFNSFRSDLKTTSRIDHIFLTSHFAVDRYGVLTLGYWTPRQSTTSEKGHDAPSEIQFNSQTLRFPSDHYPVMARIHLLP